ncbi:AAA family ATPase [Klebsiella aerogenes]|uniref:AAA family ATPase n=1 Tax=Klebsiella aerogenes TaxID=548 RepID=UPI0035D1D96F
MLLRKIVIDGIQIDLVNDGYIKNERSYFSIIVGPNGSGKSRILEAISATGIIRQYLEFKGRKSADGRKNLRIDRRPIGFLDGVSFKESCLFYENKESNNLSVRRFNPNYPGVSYDRFACEFTGDEVPSKIICVTNSIFNKFPSVTNTPFMEFEYDYSYYQNLSISEDILEDSKGLVHGSKSRIFSKLILNSFFSGKETFNKLVYFLNTFGISGGYKLHLRAGSMLQGVSSKGVYDVSKVREWYERKGKLKNQDDRGITKDIIDVLDEVFKNLFTKRVMNDYETFDNSHFFPDSYSFQIDINNENDSDSDLNKKIKLIAEYGFIYVEKIEFTKNDRDISLDSMSSGEINLFLLLFKINSVIEDNSIILIDEPELSLHPSWQNEIVPSLQRAFSLYSGCHFIISTHSPHVVASIPENDSCVTILNDFPRAFPGHRFSGKSSDFQLFSVLGFVGAENDYLITQLILIISKLSEEVPLSQGEQYLLEEAGNILKNESTSSRVKHLILQAQRLNGVDYHE